jgi:hypothetical protein
MAAQPVTQLPESDELDIRVEAGRIDLLGHSYGFPHEEFSRCRGAKVDSTAAARQTVSATTGQSLPTADFPKPPLDVAARRCVELTARLFRSSAASPLTSSKDATLSKG